ncbi:MAG: hypothetical protein K2O89_01820 [Clostridia bacterium]|nr:hypothetical protein [Clostridia bacterium]
MKTHIENLYYWKECCNAIPLSDECKKLYDEVMKLYNEFLNCLNDNQKRQYDDYEELENKLKSAMYCQHFKEGFKIGIALAAEAFPT